MPAAATLAIAVALGLDLVFAEPPRAVHPVAAFGRIVGRFDRESRHPAVVGLLVAVVLPLLAAVAVALPVAILARWSVALAGVVAGVVLFTTLSLRMLLAVGSSVVAASESDLEGARETVVSLVGRDTQSLSPPQIRSAAVESVAENLADGLVAPLLGFVLGSLVALPLGVGLAAWVKAVNTLDSMLGYPEKPVGTASARLDDAVEWIPARLSAVLIALGALDPGALGRARSWVDAPASPNSGWPMATLAAAADLRLEKPDAYDLRPDGDLPTAQAATRAIGIVGRAGLLGFGLAGVVAWL